MKESDSKIKSNNKDNKAQDTYRDVGDFKQLQDISKITSLSFNNLDNAIKRLYKPNFLGSIHLSKEAMGSSFSTVENLLKGELELKLNRSLRNTMFNPITKLLILITITFNIIWILALYL